LVLGFREIRQETIFDAQGEAQQAGKWARQQATVKKNSFKVQGSKFNVAQNHPKRSVV
jgi:hypothetical protein